MLRTVGSQGASTQQGATRKKSGLTCDMFCQTLGTELGELMQEKETQNLKNKQPNQWV